MVAEKPLNRVGIFIYFKLLIMRTLDSKQLENLNGGDFISGLLGGIACGFSIGTGNVVGVVFGCGALLYNILN